MTNDKERFKKTYNKLIIICTNEDDCPMSDGDVWCICKENGLCPYLQLGVQN